MEKNFADAIMAISGYTLALPALLALGYIRSKIREKQLLSFLILVYVVVEILARFVVTQLNLGTNLPLLHLLTIIEFALIASLFGPKLKDVFPIKYIHILIVAFSVFSISNSIFNESIFQFNALARSVEAILLIVLALLYYYSMLKGLSVIRIEQDPMFWISSGILLYYSSSLFVYIYSNTIFGRGSDSYTIWGLHAFMTIVQYLFYTIALWVKPAT